ncbi:hypothetical protein EHS25_009957 [Saitozyma podzolica]|uniref:THIF-type NAD/FAD binding fold domain-containing protein n=1 Tax=Saitozyma podzolica TaxID=1890683 RepID=A0A427YI75_9TREE|nr:hypothetical protein EHS25_009957 [Saitozyma podzolica]
MSSNDLDASADLRNGQITEDEASLYDRQIRLWGLEAQNRMRSSSVLLLSLRSLAHETIKNLVLAGIGRLIVMDEGVVTEEDLGGGFLFREEEGAVGQERTAAALPQIASLNPLVSLTAIPTLSPFVRDQTINSAELDDEAEMVAFLKRERVDVVVACDMTRKELEVIDGAARKAGAMFYGAGTYGFHGYVFADLGPSFELVVNPPKDNSTLLKKSVSYSPLSAVLDRSNWSLSHSESAKGGSPFRGLTRHSTKERSPNDVLGILALWEFEHRHDDLPSGKAGQREELLSIAEELRVALGINEKALPSIASTAIDHLAEHATAFFPPTLAIVGGLLAQDVLRALSKKDKPIVNLLAVDTMNGTGAVTRWAMGDMVDAA